MTILRLLLIPVFVYLALLPPPAGTLGAAAAFGAASLTDLFDGMVARRTGSVTEFGKIADPLVDRALIISVLIVLIVQGVVPLWAAALVIGRDVVMVLGYKMLQTKGAKLSVSFLGKVSTAVLMLSIVALILRVPAAVYAFYFGVALSLLSAAQYVWLTVGGGGPRLSEGRQQ